MDFIRRLESFLQLRNHLQNLNETEISAVKNKAHARNPWFTADNISLAFKGIFHLLNEAHLQRWTSQYVFGKLHSKRVGVIAAGNIPMVGFHDAMCVLLSGHKLHIKLSHQDDILLPFVFDQLNKLDEGWRDRIVIAEKLNDVDALIATGSDNSARYFEYYFRNVPKVIRKNRTSLAILHGDESDDELTKLADDLYQYFGFGCRNVSKVLLPKGYKITHLLDHLNHWNILAEHHKFINNYNYHRSIYSMEKIPYLDNGFSIFTQSSGLVSPTSVVYFDFYDDTKAIHSYVIENEDKLQCIVAGDKVGIKDSIVYGNTQLPSVWEYADNVDTMKFLLSI